MKPLVLLCLVTVAASLDAGSPKPPSYEELGCYRDKGRRDLPFLAEVKAMTIYRCRDRCRHLKYRYAGLQASNYCFCGNRYGRYGKSDKSKCASHCGANKEELCGGSWHNNVYATGVGKAAFNIRPLGCFKDTGTRDLPEHAVGVKADVNSCLERCKDLGYKYAGVQAGSYCFCGDSYGKYGKQRDSECATPCSANPMQICGGTWHSLVYETGYTPVAHKSLGCFIDKGTRDLPDYISTEMSIQRCINRCKKLGYKYAGMQAGSYCFCGNKHGRYGKAPESQCHYACTGKRTEKCGGAWRNSIYSTGRSAEEFHSLGCYIEKYPRDLPFTGKAGRVTRNNCRVVCASHGFLYFGVQNGNHCFCGNSYGRYGKAADSDCSKKCAGDPSQTCGNGWRNEIFATNVKANLGSDSGHAAQSAADEHERSIEQSVNSDRVGKLLDISQRKMRKFGCFRDAGNRDLPEKPFVGALSVHYCRWTCRKLKYRYFAMQAANYCFCGNHFGKYGQSDDSKCTSRCAANKNQICGGAWHNSLYSTDISTKEAHSFKPIGCYVDKGTRDLPVLGAHCPKISVNTCVKTCKDLGFKYAGTQAGAWCYCGDEYGKYGKAADSDCHTRCHANKRQICGGSWRNQVYETRADISVPPNLGCYKDKAVHDLVEMAKAGVMSINYCRKLCRELGYRYAGVQYSNQCWCGNSYGRYGKVAESFCNRKCTGHNKQICGGALYNNIYESGKPAFVFKSMGCYVDKAVRDLPYMAKIGKVNLNNCRQLCWRYGYRYFGVQNGNTCNCGDSYNKYGRVDDARCAKPCLGNKAQTCGDHWLNNIYETGVGNDDESSYITETEPTEAPEPEPTKAPKPEPTEAPKPEPTEAPKPEPTEAPKPEPTEAPKPEPTESPKPTPTESTVIDGDTDSETSVEPDGNGASKVEHKGCFANKAYDLDLPDLVFTGAVTIQKCVNLCAQRFYRFAGVQGGSQCYCGDSYGKHGKASDCNVRCLGNNQQVCGGKESITIYTTVVSYRFASRGCFKDEADRDLPRLAMSGAISIGRCFRHCAKLGFYYAGVQYGTQCFCGNTYNRYGKAADEKCNMKCHGNKRQICGGFWHQNIYRTTFKRTSRTALGCYKDSDDHDLPELVKKGQMSVDMCINECSELGYKYAGLQNGNMCFCGNTYGRYGKGEAAICTTVCSGNKNQMCGGAEYNLIFETGVTDVSFQKIGCYKDAKKRDLPYLVAKGENVNLNNCRARCWEYGFLYFGVQAGTECRCGDTYGHYGKASSENDCNVKCSGNRAQICGGASYIQSVYATGVKSETIIISEGIDSGTSISGDKDEIIGGSIATISSYGNVNITISYEYIWTVITFTELMQLNYGCFKDSAERDLPTLAAHGSHMTVESCVKTCQTRGFKFAGLQHGKECFCGNQFGLYGPTSDNNCQKPCAGDGQVMCGGDWANSIYSTSFEEISGIVQYFAKPTFTTHTHTTIIYYDEHGNPINTTTHTSTNTLPDDDYYYY